MEETIEYLYTKEEAAQMREKIMDECVKPRAKACFERFPQLQSIALLVAQYWDDEANDAVHEHTIFSVLETPDLEAAFKAEEENKSDRLNLQDLTDVFELENVWWAADKLVEETSYWDDNATAIPAFAAFCQEGAHQGMSTREAYTPYAILRRRAEDIEVELVGQMLRPQLDGIKPEEWDEEW
jgi:hypothetical protein